MNCLPKPHVPAIFHTQALGDLRTPTLDKFAQVAADVRNILKVERIAEQISALRNLEPADVVLILKALELADRGECAPYLQECREGCEDEARIDALPEGGPLPVRRSV